MKSDAISIASFFFPNLGMINKEAALARRPQPEQDYKILMSFVPADTDVFKTPSGRLKKATTS